MRAQDSQNIMGQGLNITDSLGSMLGITRLYQGKSLSTQSLILKLEDKKKKTSKEFGKEEA